MGGGPSGGGDDTNVSNKSLSKAKAATKARDQRQAMAQSGVQDPLEFTRLAENLQAQKLERSAAGASLTGSRLGDLAIPGAGTLSLVQQIAQTQQARELRRGGEMITDESGEYKGVVSTNFLGGRVYSGDPAFDPIGGGTNSDDNNSMVTQRPDITPERTAEVTPEVIPNDEPITTRYARKRTRRAGQGGTILEGYGVLTRPASKRSVT